ncbi:MAG: hypothetical protein ABI543_09965 [Ignavibacteria bacterium]
MNNTIKINQTDVVASNICRNLIKELIMRSDKYNVSPAKFNTLVKAYYTLESYPIKKITGYIDISANTHLPGGSLDYSSFTIGEDYFEIYTGYVSYEGGECDDSSWDKIYSSKDDSHRKNVGKALECWAESFLLHLDENPARSLLIIDRSELEGDEAVLTEIKPQPRIITPEYAYLQNREYEEVPF